MTTQNTSLDEEALLQERRQIFLQLINDIRAKYGVPPVELQ